MVLKNIDAAFITMFLDSMQATFSKIFQSELSRGTTSLWGNQVDQKEIAILTGITGDGHSGFVVYSMSNETAKKLISYLDPEVSSAGFKESLYDSLGEIVNIISGNTITYFSQNHYNLEITSPSVISGNEFRMYLLNQAALTTDMMSPFGMIGVDIAMKYS